MRNSLAMSLVFVLAVTSAAIAKDSPSKVLGWQTAFEPTALSSQFDVRGKTLLIVGSGTRSPELDAAVGALEVAYRRTAGSGTVMGTAGLPSMNELDDQAIVKAAHARPWHFIVIVRLFPDANGVLKTAVVTIYDPDGEAQYAFTTSAGTRLPLSTETSHAARGVTRRAADTISEINDEHKEQVEGGRKTYDREYIYIPRTYASELPRTTFAYQGNLRRGITGAKFYRAVGRDDLAAKYTSSNQLRWGLGIGGAMAALTGLVVMNVGFLDSIDCIGLAPDTAVDKCDAAAGRTVTIGLIIAGVGSLATLGIWINPNPVSAAEANQLVATHNAQLRKRLRLPEDYRPKRLAASKSRVLLTPFVGPTGGGLVLHVDF